MRLHFVGLLLLLAGFALGLKFYVGDEADRAETARFSARSSKQSPGERPKEKISEEEERSRTANVTDRDEFADAGKPDLLASWACASTRWETGPDMVYVRGIVKNASSRELSDVAAEVTFIGRRGDTLGTEEGNLDRPHLAPERISTFFFFWPADNQTPRCTVTFKDGDGPLRSIRASALEADEAHPFVGRWTAADGIVSMDFFRNSTALVVTDRGVALGAGRYKVIDPNLVELRLSMPPEGVTPGYLYPYDQWRALAGRTLWHYLPSRDALSLWKSYRQIFLVRGAAGRIGETTGEVTEEIVLEAQKQLRAEGFDPGPLDGVLGPGTRAALAAFQTSQNLEETQELDEDTLWALGLGWLKRGSQQKTSRESR